MTIINSGDLSTIGICLDIIGAFFLAQSFIIKSQKMTIVEASDYMDGNPYRLKSAVSQRIEAWTGFIFLALGFVVQLSVYQAFVTKGVDDNLLLTIGLPGALLLTAILVTTRLKRKYAVKAVVDSFALKRRVALELGPKRSMKTEEGSLEAAAFYGEVIDVKKRKNESIDEYVGRVLEAYRKFDN